MKFPAKSFIIVSKNELVVGSFLLLLTYPLFYYSYKYCLPDFGGEDFYTYYLLYKDWEFEKVPAPFNMRLISSGCIFLLNKAGLYYETKTVMSKMYSAYIDHRVYFNAILFNSLCVFLTCLVIYRTVCRQSGNPVYSIMFACLYLFGFGTLFFSLKPQSDACGIFLAACIDYFYRNKSPWSILLLVLSVFQREYLCILFGILALTDYFYYRTKFFGLIFIICCFCFFLYYSLRMTFFYTPHLDFQFAISEIISDISFSGFHALTFLKQSLLLSNLFLLYLLAVIYKMMKKMTIQKSFLVVVIVLFVQVIVMSILVKFGNNAGRYFYYASPVIIYFLSVELKPLLSPYFRFGC